MRQNRNSQNRFGKPTGPRGSGRPIASGSQRKPEPKIGKATKPAPKKPAQNAPATRNFAAKASASKTFATEARTTFQKDAARKPEAKPHSRPQSRPDSPANSRPEPSFKRTIGRGRAAAAPPAPQAQGQRVAKIIARAGRCSRRDAEAWIAEGRVSVNGKVLSSPAVTLGPSDQITIDGVPLAARQRTRLFLFHKPRGLVTTNKDPEGRPTIFDYLHQHAPDAPRLMSIGRLDINTEGLLLLTNDGGLARVLELPSTGWLRRYRVRANGETNQAILDGLTKGVTIEGIRYAGIEAVLDRQQGANCWLTLGLREGKNREIKRVLEHLGLTVNRLIRISFGPFQLGDLGEGKIEEVRTRVLRDQLGTALAQAAGVDFDAALETAHEERPQGSSELPARRPRPAPGPGAKTYAGPRPKRAEPEPEKIRSRPRPGPRKHISALRAEGKGRDAENPRQRIERGEIADRKGRAVTIERHVAAAGPAKKKPVPRGQQDTGRQSPGRPTRPGAPRPGAPKPGAPRPGAPKPGAGGKGRRTK